MQLFHSEFYPTPTHVLDSMGIDCYGLTVLEPSCGSGNIIDYLKANGAEKVLACEIDPRLRAIATSKAQLIGTDFLKVQPQEVSHVQLIVMNPPFSCADKHILHAWEIAPEGCAILALCNINTLNYLYSPTRTQLGQLVSKYGTSESLGQCFTEAERRTDVEVGLVRLFKPVVSEEFNWDGFYYSLDHEPTETGLVQYNDIRALVNTYVGAVKCFSKVYEAGQELNKLTGETCFHAQIGREDRIQSRDDFARAFQVRCWQKLFGMMNLQQHVSSTVMAEINKFAASRQAYPFTVRNAMRMLEIIFGTREQTMQKSIVAAVDEFTKYTHDNRHSVEGWKTNQGHLLAPKFIVSGLVSPGYSELMRFNRYAHHGASSYEKLLDLTKALCALTGTAFQGLIPNVDEVETGVWFDWGFFDIKVYKKGSGHIKFKDKKVWEQLNRTYAKIKGQVLPENL